MGRDIFRSGFRFSSCPTVMIVINSFFMEAAKRIRTPTSKFHRKRFLNWFSQHGRLIFEIMMMIYIFG